MKNKYLIVDVEKSNTRNGVWYLVSYRRNRKGAKKIMSGAFSHEVLVSLTEKLPFEKSELIRFLLEKLNNANIQD